MESVEVVIKIPEEARARLAFGVIYTQDMQAVCDALSEGIILPEEHGDLVDRKKIFEHGNSKGFCDWYEELKYAKPIIKADKEAEKEKPNTIQQTMDFFKNLYLQNKNEIDKVAKEYEQYKADDILPQCMQMPLKTYEVWMEGYSCTGQSKQHEFIGAVKAESFEKACEIAVKQWCKSVADFDKYYDAKTQTFWGCKCYDNESDAAKGFG